MITNVYGGLASGYFKTQNIDPTIGTTNPVLIR